MRIAKIKPNDVANGEGLIVSVWVQGCPHHCKGCFNKETWDFNGGREFNCEDYTTILDMLDADGIKRNLSILGGEPMARQNVIGVLSLINFIKSNRPDTKVYLWSGYTYEQIQEMYGEDVLKDFVDVLIDGQFILEEKDLTLKLRGSSNQRIINISKKIPF